ncbi:MAG TPA: UvrB/UvrC motif-containing protein [Gemmatales bacterium]|nr:UvrB/UvrC motif-containing protein [Gemmatales bacterium]
MIPCSRCGQAAATEHLIHVGPDGSKSELHLCTACAEKAQIVAPEGLQLPAVLQALIGTHVGALSDELSRLVCPSCGIKYMEFRAEGRLGCPHDYAVFRVGLLPLLKKIHRHERHAGKQPKRRRRSLERDQELLRLRRELSAAIDQEAYEQAAVIRDRIREKEAEA